MIIVMKNSKIDTASIGKVVRDEPNSFIVSVPGSGGHWCRIRKDACSYVMHGNLFANDGGYGKNASNMLLAIDGWEELSDAEHRQLWEEDQENFKKFATLVERKQLEDGRWQEIYTIPLTSELTDTHS